MSLNQNSERKLRVVVAMSGGVDSSVAATLLARQGHEVVGVTMRLFNSPFQNSGKLGKSCCSLEDVEDARTTCRIIGAKHYYLNFEKEFEQHVIDYFVSEYEQGRTPLPCVACNDRMKFDFLMKRATLMGADALATGHYARIQTESDGSKVLLRGTDSTKDQSYVLFNLRQKQMCNLILPIGGFSKNRIRAIAVEEGLPVADKPDSQDICFIPTGGYRKFVEKRLATKKTGIVADADGNVLGEHGGIHRFTIGQRKGLPINDGTRRPTYVTSIDPNSGVVTVGSATDLLKLEVFASGVNWISGAPPPKNAKVSAKIRYSGNEESATVEMTQTDRAVVRFDRPMRAVTPGQAIVFYDGEAVLGGGFIDLGVQISPPDHAHFAKTVRV